MPVKYTDELKTRAVEFVIHPQAYPTAASGAITRFAKELALSRETLRVWVSTQMNSGKSIQAESVDLETESRTQLSAVNFLKYSAYRPAFSYGAASSREIPLETTRHNSMGSTIFRPRCCATDFITES